MPALWNPLRNGLFCQWSPAVSALPNHRLQSAYNLMAASDLTSQLGNRRNWYHSPKMGVTLLTLAALAIRMLALGDKSLLTDEGSSLYFSQLPIATLLWSLCDPHPPGYYLLVRAVAVFGDGEAWLRAPSALAGTLAVPVTWAVARAALRPLARPQQRWPDQAALLAAALVAVSPLHIWYSQEARAYALLSLLTLLMVLAGLRWYLQPTAMRAIGFLASGWLALFTEYGALVIWLGLNLFLLSGWPWHSCPPAAKGEQQRRIFSRPWQWAALQAALLVPFGLWWLVSAQRASLANMSYQGVFLATQAQKVGLAWTPEEASRVITLVMLGAAGLGLLLALAVRRSPRVRRWLGGDALAVALAVLVLLLGIWGVVPRLYTVKRHLTTVIPYVSIAAAWALLYTSPHQVIQRRWRNVIAAALPVILLPLALINVLAIPKPAWREAASTLASQVQFSDSVWVDELDAPVFAYYWRNRTPWQPLYSDQLSAVAEVSDAQRLWLIGTVSEYRDLQQTLPPEFVRSRAVAERYDWPAIALRAYDYSELPQPVLEPPIALRWGLLIQSPLDRNCR